MVTLAMRARTPKRKTHERRSTRHGVYKSCDKCRRQLSPAAVCLRTCANGFFCPKPRDNDCLKCTALCSSGAPALSSWNKLLFGPGLSSNQNFEGGLKITVLACTILLPFLKPLPHHPAGQNNTRTREREVTSQLEDVWTRQSKCSPSSPPPPSLLPCPVYKQRCET